MDKKYTCPVCGCNNLDEMPYDENGIGTWEMCQCCSFETGMFCESPTSIEIFKECRNRWLELMKEKKTDYQLSDAQIIKQLNNIDGWMFEKNKKGSSYGEFQFCTTNLSIKELIDSQNVEFWKDDSLFIEYATPISDLFWKYYLPLLNNAYLDEDKKGFNDYGINYYTPEQTIDLYNKIKNNERLPDKHIFLKWLKMAIEKKNGFYFLGD